MSDENIIQLDVIRIERHKPRKCTCERPKFTIDVQNHEITCQCGMVHDAFDAFLSLAKHYESINCDHRMMHEQRIQWLKEKPYSVIFKNLERHYSRGTMLPSCPVCDSTFDFEDITFWSNAEFYRKLQQKKKEEK